MAEENPSHLKLAYLKKYAKGDVFIETGTYMGDTVKIALEYGFKHIHSIELNEDLYKAAVEMFKDNPEVKIWLGDSVDIIPKIIDQHKDQEITFWLDAHASGPLAGGRVPCPLLLELNDMSDRYLKFNTTGATSYEQKDQNYIVFIDDRRLLGTEEWGGVQEPQVLQALQGINKNYKFYLEDGHIPQDIIVASWDAPRE